MTLPTLPTEILSLIVQAVKANDEENRHYYAFRTAERVYTYEERAGLRRWLDIVALSEVNSTFWALCKPVLWKSLNLAERNNADLLYLLKVILPRHGRLIQTFWQVNMGIQSARDDKPRYICDALGISHRFGYPSLPASQALDIEVPGEPVALDMPSYGFDDDWRRHMARVIAQRIELQRLIFERTLTPNLKHVFWEIDFGDTSHNRQLPSLVLAFGSSRLVKFSMYAMESGYRPEDEEIVEQSYSTMAQLVCSHPSLEELNIEVAIPGSDQETMRDTVERHFLKSIRNLTRLRHLTWTGAPISQSYMTNLCAGPLTYVDLDPLEITWPNCVTFLNQFHATLQTIKLYFQDIQQPIIHDPVPSSEVKPFPRLTELSLGGDLPAYVVTNFATAPLESVSMALLSDGPTYTEWMELIEVHGVTLKEIYGAQDRMTVEEVAGLKEATSSRGISSEWDWYEP